MEQKELVERLRKNPAALQQVMQSQDGQALMRMLNGSDGGATLQKAAMQAAGGNTTQMVQMLQKIMQSPEGSALVQRINQSLQK